MFCCCFLTGRPASFDIKFRIADDYPVDLYYIMDLSFSMKDDKENLIKLGVDLGKLNAFILLRIIIPFFI